VLDCPAAEICSRNIVDIEQKLGAQREHHPATSVRPQNGADFERGLADADRIAHFQAQPLREAHVGMLRRSECDGRRAFRVGSAGKSDRPAQRIADTTAFTSSAPPQHRAGLRMGCTMLLKRMTGVGDQSACTRVVGNAGGNGRSPEIMNLRQAADSPAA